MSKVITSPIKRFPGTVTIPDPMTWDQLSRWGDFVSGFKKNSFDNLRAEAAFIPGFVEKIDIVGFPVDSATNPPKQLKAFSALMDWIVGEILQVIEGDEIGPFMAGGSTPG